MEQNYLILLPPSEGKEKGGEDSKTYRFICNLRKYNRFITLRDERDYIYNKLREAINTLEKEELVKIFDISEKKLQEVIETTLDMLNLEALPAIERFSGTMFKAIDYFSLEQRAKENFNNSVYFVDGMFGLLSAQDYIPEYKLKISAKFLDIDLTQFWKRRLRSEFSTLTKDKFVIDLLPQTHEKVLSLPESANHIKITFYKKEGEQLKNEGHNSKKLKGELIRYVVREKSVSYDKLKEFRHSQGHSFSKEHSSEKELVFIKQ